MAHGFRIICEKCGSEDCTIHATDRGGKDDLIRIEIECEECGQIE